MPFLFSLFPGCDVHMEVSHDDHADEVNNLQVVE